MNTLARLRDKQEAVEARASHIAHRWRDGDQTGAVVEIIDRTRGPRRVLLAVHVYRELAGDPDAAEAFLAKLSTWTLDG